MATNSPLTVKDHEATSRRSTLRIEIAPRILLWIVLALAGVWAALQLVTVLIVVTMALVMVGTLDPLVSWLQRRGMGRGRALVLVMLAMTLVTCAGLLLAIPPLIDQIMHLLEVAPAARDDLVARLSGYSWSKPLIQVIHAVPVEEVVANTGHILLGYSSKLLSIIGYGISTVFLAIYLLADPVRARGFVFALVPRHRHVTLARILLELKVIVGGYMRGQLITSVAISVFVFGVLTVCRVENAIALALFAGLTDIIPFVGGYVASVPVILAVSDRGTAAMVVVTVLMVLYQEFESRILIPRVYGRVLRLSPAIVIVALLVGGTLMGIVGALLALPIAAGVQMLVRELRVDLPGEGPADAAEAESDEDSEHLYAQLSEGVTAANAGVIAGQLAEAIKETEQAASIESNADIHSKSAPTVVTEARLV